MTDEEFMTHIIAEVCDYAVKNSMEPDDTLSVITNNIKALLKISTFNNWKGGEAKIIIPGVEMPKSCLECDSCGLSDVVGLKCPCDANKELYSYDKRPEECPLKGV